MIDYKIDETVIDKGYDKQLMLYSACIDGCVKPYIYSVKDGRLISVEMKTIDGLLKRINEISDLLRRRKFEEVNNNKDGCKGCSYRYLELSTCSEAASVIFL